MSSPETALTEMIRSNAVGGTMQDMISNGVPEIGWKGDPDLTLCWHKTMLRWEIWDMAIEFKPDCVYRSRTFASSDELPDIFQVCLHMRDHDFRNRGIDEILAGVDADNEKMERERSRVNTERTEAMLRKVYWGLDKDIGHLY